MRPSTLVRSGAVLTATALAITLGTGPASATDSTSSSAVRAAAPAAEARGSFADAAARTSGPVKPAAVTLGTFRLNSGVITSKDLTGIFGDVIPSGSGTVTSAVTTVTVNGVVKGQVPLYPGDDNGGVDIPRVWGSGAVVLGPTTFNYQGEPSSLETKKSNTFYVRKNIKTTRSDGIALRIRRVNSKISFKAQQIKIVNPSSGQYVSAGSVKLQYKSGSTWKTKKTIKLDSSGNGSYSRTTSSKYRYRLFISKTSRSVEFRTEQSDRI